MATATFNPAATADLHVDAAQCSRLDDAGRCLGCGLTPAEMGSAVAWEHQDNARREAGWIPCAQCLRLTPPEEIADRLCDGCLRFGCE